MDSGGPKAGQLELSHSSPKLTDTLRKKGQNPNRTHSLPFGKRCVAGKVVDHKGEQRVISSVLKMHGEGLSNCAITRVLTQMKVPTKQQGRGWHPEMVRQILLHHQQKADQPDLK